LRAALRDDHSRQEKEPYGVIALHTLVTKK